MKFLRLTEEEQKLYILLFINEYNKERKSNYRKIDEELLMAFVPDMRCDPPDEIDAKYMNEVLSEFREKGYIEIKPKKGKIYYRISNVGMEYLKENELWIPFSEESLTFDEILECFPHQALKSFFRVLSDSQKSQMGVMYENVRFFITPLGPETIGVCDDCIRCITSVGCRCSDIMAARRAIKEGPHYFKCHAGFVECIAPFNFSFGKNGTQYGFVFMGRMIHDKLDANKLIDQCKTRAKFFNKTFGSSDIENIIKKIEGLRQSDKDIDRIGEITIGIADLLSDLASETRVYRSKIEMLNDVVESSASVLESTDILLSSILQTIKSVFNNDGSTIWKFIPGQEMLKPLATDNGLAAVVTEPLMFQLDERKGFIPWIARKRETLLINDINSHLNNDKVPKPKYPDYMRKRKLHSLLGVPILAEGKLIGVIEIEKHQRGEFSKLDEILLITVAHIIGMVIKRIDLLKVLSEISKKNNLSDLLATAVEKMPNLLNTEYCSIFLYDSSDKKLFLRATNSPMLEGKVNRAYYDEDHLGLTWHVLKTGKTVMLENVEGSEHWKGLHQEAKPKVYLGCPIKDKSGESIGVIRFTAKPSKESFNNDDKRLVEDVLSTRLSLEIDRINLIKARQHNRLLLKIGEIQNISTSIEGLLNEVAREMTGENAFDCEGCEISIFNKESGVLEVIGSYGSEKTKKRTYKLDENRFTVEVFKAQNPIRCLDICDFFKERGRNAPKRSIGSRLGIQLIVGGETIGVLKLAKRRISEDHPVSDFNDDDEITGKIIAGEITKTIDLFQRRISLTELLREVDQRYIESRDALSAVGHMLKNLDKAIDGSWGCIYKFDPGRRNFVRIGYSAKKGFPPEETDFGHIKKAYNRAEPSYIDDALNSREHQEILEDKEIDENVKDYIRSIGSEYAIPMMVQGRAYGVFLFFKAEGFNINDQQLSRDLAIRASLILENYELLEAHRKLYNQSSRLQKELDIKSPSRVNNLHKMIVDIVVNLGYDRARLYLTSSDGKMIESVAQKGLIRKKHKDIFENKGVTSKLDIALQIPESREVGGFEIGWYALLSGKPIIFAKKGSKSEKTFKQRDITGAEYIIEINPGFERELEKENVNEWVDIPLIAENIKLGKISVDNKWSRRPFLRIDFETLDLFGQYAAQAILNSLDIEKTVGFGLGARALAHSIKNKIAGSELFIDLIEENPSSNDVPKYIGFIHQAYSGITGSVNAMRKLADLEDTKPEVITIRDLVYAVWNELKLLEPKEIKCSIAPEIYNEQVMVDRDQIIEVFVNLMINSKEAGGNNIEIALSIEIKDKFAYVYWEDNGPGIPENFVDELFLLGKTTKIELGGTGTGLFSAKRMLLKNGGDIWLDKSKRMSSGNYAARFIVKIPLLNGAGENRCNANGETHPCEGGSANEKL